MYSVLYVDDETDLLEICKIFLENSGDFIIETTTSATSGLDILKTRSFDAIISDYQMPGMDGIEFLKKIRSCFGDLPFILFTGKGRENVVIEAINNGADFYLQKGGDPEAQFAELAHKIRQALLRKKAEEALRVNEARLHRAENVAGFGNWEINLATKNVTASIGARTLYGLGDGILSLSDIKKITLPEYSPLLDTALEGLVERGTPYNIEFKIRRVADGQLFDIHSIAEFDPRKNIVFGVIHDVTEQKLAEEELRETEQRLGDIINFLPDATFAIDNMGRVIAWNRAIENMTGVRAEHILGKGNFEYALPFYGERRPILIDLIMMEDAGVLTKNYSALKKEDNAITAETDHAFVGGKYVYLWGKSTLFKNAHGEISGAIESIRDITERKKAEQSLKKSESNYRALIENMQDCLHRSDLQDHLIFASPSLARLLGYSTVEELYGEDIAGIFYKDPEERRKFIDAVYRTGSVSNFQATFKKTDGTSIDVETNSHVYYDDDGKIAGIEGILHDITTRNIAEKTIKESEQKYRDLVEHSTDIIYTLDFRGIITSISPSLTPHLGYTPGEVIGKNIGEYITPMSLEIATREMSRKEDNEINTSRYEIGIRSKDGNIIPYEIHSRTRFREGKPFDILGIARDITDSKHKEEVLIESEIKFRSLVETSPDMIWEIDTSATFTYISPQIMDILGYPPDEVTGKPFFSLIPQKFIEELTGRFQSHFRSGARINVLEVPAYHRDGTLRHIEIRSSPVVDETGKITGFRGIAHDITDQKRANEALRESEERFRTLVEQMQDAVVIAAFDGTILFANPSMFRMIGLQPGDLPPGANISHFLDPDSLDQVFLDLKAISEGNPPFIAEYQLKTPGSEPRWIVATGLRINYQGSWADLVTIHEITGAKLAEKELRESEEKIRDLIINTPDIVWQTDESSRFIYVSPQVETILGYPPEYLIGRTPFEMIRADGIAANRETFSGTTRKHENIVIYTTPWIHRDGHIVELESHAKPVFHSNGTFAGYHGIDRDITERRKSEYALRQANRQLNLLTSITRHDILNKVTVILGHLAIAGKKSPDPAMSAIIEKLVSATKAIRSQIEFTRVFQDLGTHDPRWQDLGKIMPYSYIPAAITLTESVDGVEVFADPMFELVFSNLLDNSVRHGHHVTAIRVSSSRSNHGLTIIWEDNGAGIPAEEKEIIFERGFGKNTGFGLFLVREILSISGITIRETGTEGEGARFEINVPEGGYRHQPSR
jgi:PAS domain S-box-containing protein